MKVFKNVLLIIALGAVVIMAIAIYLYDFIPTSVTVAQPSTYKASAETTKVIDEIDESSSDLADAANGDGNAKSNIVLKTYEVTSNDLAIYQAIGSLSEGKADPFKPIDENPGANTDENNNNNSNSDNNNNSSSEDIEGPGEGSGQGGSSSNTQNNLTTVPDGTLLNSKSKK